MNTLVPSHEPGIAVPGIGGPSTCDAEEVIPAPRRLVLVGKFKADRLEFSIPEDETLRDLKERIADELDIPVNRQKLIGIKHVAAGGPVTDSTRLLELAFSGTDRNLFTIMGTPVQLAPKGGGAINEIEEEEEDDSGDDGADQQFNSIERQKKANTLVGNAEVLRLHDIAMRGLKIVWIKQPATNKKLLVLDIDYTLYDCKGASKVINAETLRRPYLHEFLHAIAPHYDYVLWSQTRWQWVEMKITDLGLLRHENLKPCFSLDKSQMIEMPSNLVKDVGSSKLSSRKRHVKWLKVLWDISPNRWGAHNTLHVDDLTRNFLLNPRNGIPIVPYRRSMSSFDRELLHLMRYLIRCAALSDVRDWDHSKWRSSEHASL